MDFDRLKDNRHRFELPDVAPGTITAVIHEVEGNVLRTEANGFGVPHVCSYNYLVGKR